MTRSWDPHDVAHPDRQTWDEYFLSIARTAQTRSICSQRTAGAVIVRERHIVSTGYVGAPSGHPHCDPNGACGRGDCVAVDAEANALLFCGPRERAGATLYSTRVPDLAAAKLIANSGISEVVTDGPRVSDFDQVRDLLLRSAVRVRRLEAPRVLDLAHDGVVVG